MHTNMDIQFIKYISDIDSNGYDIQELVINFEEIKHIICDKFENITKCKLYNKSQIIKDIELSLGIEAEPKTETETENETDKSKLQTASIKAIKKNIVPEITFNSMFKSDLDFDLVFSCDEIIVLYNNKKIELDKLNDIKTYLLTDKLSNLPIINNLYVNNILTVIEKLINKDISVKYHLTEFPIPYWNLFEIKCKKSKAYSLTQLDKCKHLDDIISGQIYNQPVEPELKNEKNNCNIANGIISNGILKERDIHHRMEIMSFLNDEEILYFLEKLESIDNIEESNKNNIKWLLNIISETSNKMIKYYMCNNMVVLILKNKKILIDDKKFRETISKTMNELYEGLYVIETADLDFTKEITLTFKNYKQTIYEIEHLNDNQPTNLI